MPTFRMALGFVFVVFAISLLWYFTFCSMVFCSHFMVRHGLIIVALVNCCFVLQITLALLAQLMVPFVELL